MGIMADALGVSIVQLDKMLKAGSVLSSDALPKFAVALEKAYGIESVNKINTLAAAHGRLKTSWVQFVDELNASKAYIGTINLFTRQMSRWKTALFSPSATKDTAKYFDMLNSGITKAGAKLGVVFGPIFEGRARKFQSLISEMEMSESKGAAKSKEYFMDRLDTIGFSLKKAELLWEEYSRRVNGIDEQTPTKLLAFDLEGYKKDLDEAKNITELQAKLTSESLKKYTLGGSELTKWGDDYETILEMQVTAMKKLQVEAKKESDKWEEQAPKKLTQEQAIINMTEKGIDLLKVKKKLTIDEQNQRDIAASNVKNTTEALIELESRLFDVRNKKETKKKEKIDDKSKVELNIGEELYRKLKDAYDAYYIDKLSAARNDAEETANIQKEMINNALDEDKEFGNLTLAEKAKLNAELLKLDDDIEKERKRKRADASAEVLASTYESIDKEQIALQEAAYYEITSKKTTNQEIEDIHRQLTQDIIQLEIDRLNAKIGTGELIVDDEKKVLDHIAALQKQHNDNEINNLKEQNDKKRDLIANFGEATNQGFEFRNQIAENQSQNAERIYNNDVAAAGDSLEKKYLAEEKYEKEQNKIKTRQAIADKAQALFNIGLQLSLATAELDVFQIAAAILAAATVVATPIPTFAEGGEHDGGLALVGDAKGNPTKAGGAEIHISTSGKKTLLPSTPTLMDLPAGTIIPNDKTQQMLAQGAIKSSIEIIDMSGTNRHLKSIEKNTKQGKQIYTKNGRTVIRRGNTISYMQ